MSGTELKDVVQGIDLQQRPLAKCFLALTDSSGESDATAWPKSVSLQDRGETESPAIPTFP